MCDTLKSLNSSNTEGDKSSIPADQRASAARCSPGTLAIEVHGFTMMGRNEELLEIMPKNVSFHLIINYLDGEKTCGILKHFDRSLYVGYK